MRRAGCGRCRETPDHRLREDDLAFGQVKFIERWRFENIPQLLEHIKKERHKS